MRLNFVRSLYQKTSAAFLDLMTIQQTPPSSRRTTRNPSPNTFADIVDDEYNKLLMHRSPSKAASRFARMTAHLRSETSNLPRPILCLIGFLPYVLCFCLGAFVAGVAVLSFEEVTPCGQSVGETMLNYVANLTNTRWNTSATKYVVECPRFPPTLIGKLVFPLSHTPSFEEIDAIYGPNFATDSMAMGGHFKPKWCKAVSKVAIIVPYRNRDENLRHFLYYMHQIMQHQLLDYAIFVVEQAGSPEVRFNRGVLLNVGFAEAMKAYDFDCVMFYDVDKVPVDDRCSHVCPSKHHVRHMAAYQDRFERMPFRDDYFGGVLAMNSEDVKSLNGFSNIFFGYGYEDDEFLQRIKLRNLTIYREHEMLTHYRNLGHDGDGMMLFPSFDWKHENKNLLYSTDERIKFDGLNSIAYEKLTIRKFKSYTRLVVEISEKGILDNLKHANPTFYKIVAGALNMAKP